MVKYPSAVIFHNEMKIVYMYIKENMSASSIICIKLYETFDI